MGKAKKLAAPRPNPAQFVDGLSPPVRAEPLVLILVPSRELAVQIFNEARKFCYRSMLRPCVVYGGGTMGEQLEQLRKGCDVLIASPGRLVDMMGRPDRLSLRRLRYMVIDEADEMLSEDWEQELQTIMTGGGKLISPLAGTAPSYPDTCACRAGRRDRQVPPLLSHFSEAAS